MNEEELKEMYKGLKRNKKIIGTIDKDFFFEFAETVLNLLEKKNKQIEQYQNMLATNDMLHVLECEKKDKIIDEMATYIVTLDIEEDICEKTKNEHCDKMNFGECEDCIKQYFERKS